MKYFLIFLLMALSCGIGIYIGMKIKGKKSEPKITPNFISEKLQVCSDLATAVLHYNGLVHYEDGNIPFLTRKRFTMTYSADVTAGIDLSDAKVNVTEDTVEIGVPAANIIHLKINPESLAFYDEQWALLNWDKKTDLTMALRDAQQDIKDHADYEKLKAEASVQARKVITEFIAPMIGHRSIVLHDGE